MARNVQDIGSYTGIIQEQRQIHLELARSAQQSFSYHELRISDSELATQLRYFGHVATMSPPAGDMCKEQESADYNFRHLFHTESCEGPLPVLVRSASLSLPSNSSGSVVSEVSIRSGQIPFRRSERRLSDSIPPHSCCT